MKKIKGRPVHWLLALCVAGGAFYLREKSQPQTMHIPVTQVFAHAPEPTRTPLEQYALRRQTEREETLAALRELGEKGDTLAEEYLFSLLDRNEKELAVESALAAMGHADSVCAVRDGAVSICLQEKIDKQQAQAVIELCRKLTGEHTENIFLLDGCGYL